MATKKNSISSIFDTSKIQDESLRDTLAFFQGILNLATETIPSNGDKKMEEIHPIFRTMYKDLKEFVKIYLMRECGEPLDNYEVRSIKLTDIDRYMVNAMGYSVGGNTDKVTIRDNIPDGLNREERIVAKAILDISLSEKEQGILENMKKNTTSARIRCWELEYYVNGYNEGKILSDDKDYFYETIAEARRSGWFDIVPPTDEEKEYNFSDKTENAAISIETVNQLIAYIDSDDSTAGFDIIGFGKKLISSEFGPARRGLVTAVIDLVSGMVKSFMLTNSDKFNELIGVIPDKVVFDKTFDIVDGLRDVLNDVMANIIKLKSCNQDEQVELIDKIFDEIRDSSDIFESKDFENLLRSSLAAIEKKKKNDSKKDNKKAGKEISDNEKQEEVANAAMIIQSLPAFTGKRIQDNDKPEFLNVGGVKPQKPVMEKPAFIIDTDKVSIEPDTKTVAVPMVRHFIKSEILSEFDFVKEIANCATKHGVSLKMTPVYNSLVGGQPAVMTAINVVAEVNGVVSITKTFTIDLGYCIDRRVKVFANCKASGFTYLESCNEAYFVFDDKGNVLTSFFDKVFQMGFEGLNEADKKRFRMYNSNVMQLNRIIIYLSLPTGKVKGDKRQGLKDSAFKMMTQIKDINRLNGVNLGRFYVKDFDEESMSYILSNEGTYLYGQPNTAPRVEFHVHIQMDSNGKIVKDENNRAKIVYEINYVDNVFPEGFKFPDGATLITESEQVTEAADTDGDESIPVNEEDSNIVVV